MADFDYFYGQEADLFSFIRVPKLLFTDDRFKDLTSDAKILYGLLLDRMTLSIDNEWFDEKGRVYIIYTIEEIERTFGCANGKAGKTLKQLVDSGLVDRIYKGQGNASLLYVKKILSDMSKSHSKTCENRTSRNVKIASQDMRKSHAINTENNNTDFSNTDSILFSSNPIKIYPPKTQTTRNEENGKDEKRSVTDEIDDITMNVHDNIEFKTLSERFPYDNKLINEIADLMVDVLAGRTDYYIVGGVKKPAEIVKRQFNKLEYEHIAYVLESLKRNTTEVRNTRQYLIAALYNAPLTIETHYETQVNHDLAMGAYLENRSDEDE